MLLASALAASLLAACNSHPVKPGMTEQEVLESIGKPSLTFVDKTQFEGFFNDDKDCRAKTVKVMIYDRSWRKDVIVAVNANGTVECVDTAEGIAVTDFHR